MYITDWRLDAIIKLHKLTGELEEILVREPQTNRLYGVKVYSGTVQTVDHNQPCSVNNGGCEKLCFAVPRNNSSGLQVGQYLKWLVLKKSTDFSYVVDLVHFAVVCGHCTSLNILMIIRRIKVKGFCYRPVVAQRVGRVIAVLLLDNGSRRSEASAARPGLS